LENDTKSKRLEKKQKKFNFGMVFAFIEKGAQCGRLFRRYIDPSILIIKVN